MTTRTFITIIILAGIALGLGGYFLGRRQADTEAVTLTQTDTVVTYDTVMIECPVPVRVAVRDTLLVAVTDTVVCNDTVYVTLPRETKTYGDERYKAQVSGYCPALDWIEIYGETQVVTNTVEKRDIRRWGLGIQAGYGYGPKGMQPYIGIGISYNLLTL